jgi:hypothetical protein
VTFFCLCTGCGRATPIGQIENWNPVEAANYCPACATTRRREKLRLGAKKLPAVVARMKAAAITSAASALLVLAVLPLAGCA